MHGNVSDKFNVNGILLNFSKTPVTLAKTLTSKSSDQVFFNGPCSSLQYAAEMQELFLSASANLKYANRLLFSGFGNWPRRALSLPTSPT